MYYMTIYKFPACMSGPKKSKETAGQISALLVFFTAMLSMGILRGYASCGILHSYASCGDSSKRGFFEATLPPSIHSQQVMSSISNSPTIFSPFVLAGTNTVSPFTAVISSSSVRIEA